MSQKIRVKAIGYGIGFTMLSDSQLEEFLSEIEEVDDAIDIKMVSDLTDSSFYEYGFIVDQESIYLEVDDKDADEDLEALIENTESTLLDLSSPENSNWLFYEARENIDCFVTTEEYDPKKFEILKTAIKLPNGEVKTIANLYYAGEGFDTCDTTSHGHVYIVKRNGEILNF